MAAGKKKDARGRRINTRSTQHVAAASTAPATAAVSGNHSDSESSDDAGYQAEQSTGHVDPVLHNGR